MIPRSITEDDMAYWAHLNPRPAMISGPNEIEAEIAPCPAVVTDGDEFGTVVRVPWTLDEIELAHLARGGTLWLSTWGGLPIHMMEVAEPTVPYPKVTASGAGALAARSIPNRKGRQGGRDDESRK